MTSTTAEATAGGNGASAGNASEGLPFELDAELVELGDRARRFVDEVLIPLEDEAQAANGRLPAETIERIKREAIAARLNGGSTPPSSGDRAGRGSAGRSSRNSSDAPPTASTGMFPTPTTSGTTRATSSASAICGLPSGVS